VSDFRFRALISVVFQPLCPACSLFLFRRINDDKCWPIYKILSLLDSAVNLPRDSCHVAHHTYNVSLHYLVKSKYQK